MCSKKSYLIFLLLLLLQPLLFSEDISQNSVYQETMQALTDSITALENQEKLITSLENELTQLKSELTQLKTLQEISEKIIKQQSINFAQLEKSLKEQRREQITTRILDHLRGFVGGYFVNEYQDNK